MVVVEELRNANRQKAGSAGIEFVVCIVALLIPTLILICRVFAVEMDVRSLVFSSQAKCILEASKNTGGRRRNRTLKVRCKGGDLDKTYYVEVGSRP